MNVVMFFSQAIRFSTVFILGIAGVTVNEKSGHLNMGIPGILCLGVLGGLLGAWCVSNGLTAEQINPFLAVFVPALFGMLLAAIGGLLFSFFAVTLKCNQNVTGLIITTFAASLVAFFLNAIPASAHVGINNVGTIIRNLFPGSGSSDNWFVKIFGAQSFYTYFAIIVAIGVSVFLAKTRVGLNLRACGENPAAADAVGINVGQYRYVATIVSALIVGLGGVAYALDYSGGFFEPNDDFQSLGWLILSLVILSNWKSWIGIFVGFGFALLSFLQSYLPDVSGAMGYFLEMLPFIISIIILIVTSAFNTKRMSAPSALGTTYFREDR